MHRLAMISAGIGAAILLVGCAGDRDSTAYVYDDWLYYHEDWYDDDFWIWADDHPDCCDSESDVKEALRDWYEGLDPEQQQAVRDRVEAWMEEHDVAPAAGQSPRDLVLDSAAERWTALTPQERQQWLDQRRERIERRQAAGPAEPLSVEQRNALREGAANLSPEQYAALRESAQAVSFGPMSGRSISNHPVASRAGLSGGSGLRSAGGRGRGGGGRGGGGGGVGSSVAGHRSAARSRDREVTCSRVPLGACDGATSSA
jgi:hypothetical protein